MTLTRRFWSHVKRGRPNDCWTWQAGTNGKGYGCIRVRGRHRLAHRVAWVLRWRQRIPQGFCVLHHCDTPACVNWRHLFLGTRHANVQDMIAKGRMAWGERQRDSPAGAGERLSPKRETRHRHAASRSRRRISSGNSEGRHLVVKGDDEKIRNLLLGLTGLLI